MNPLSMDSVSPATWCAGETVLDDRQPLSVQVEERTAEPGDDRDHGCRCDHVIVT